MTIRVHIDRLVLDGLPIEPRDAAKVRAAVEAELARLLAGPDAPAALRAGGAVDRLDGGGLAVETDSKPAVIGERIAGSIYGSFGS